MTPRSRFRREWLPSPLDFYRAEGIDLIGRGDWRSAICPFHDDTRPSLRVHVDRGAFRCMTCGAHGGDIIDFQMQLYEQTFREAVRALGAWG